MVSTGRPEASCPLLPSEGDSPTAEDTAIEAGACPTGVAHPGAALAGAIWVTWETAAEPCTGAAWETVEEVPTGATSIRYGK